MFKVAIAYSPVNGMCSLYFPFYYALDDVNRRVIRVGQALFIHLLGILSITYFYS